MTAGRYDFVVFSDDWGRHPSSCQHLFRRIAREHRVLWVNTIGLRSPAPDRFTLLRGWEKLREWTRPLRQVSDNIWVLAPIMMPITGNGPAAAINANITLRAIRRAMRRLGMDRPILWTSIPTAADYLGKLNERAVVYYVTDDYSLWPGSNAEKIRCADQLLTERSDLILACSKPLAEGHQGPNGKTLLLPHGVDFEHFAKSAVEPQELAHIPKPRACFFGLIYEKIDLDSLHDLARRMGELQLVMIGPVKTNVDKLSSLPNVHFLGPKPYDQLPAYLQGMDVLLVPYLLDDETLNKGPLKIRECLAAGKPIVARAIPDLEAFDDLVHLCEKPADFIPAVRAALAAQSPELTTRMRERVRNDTWEARARTVLDELDRLDNARPNGLPDPPCSRISNDLPDWSDYLSRHPQGRVLHDPRWAMLMQKAYGNRPFYLTAHNGKKITGVLTLVEQRSVLFGSHLSSLPYFDAAGILADDDNAADTLIARARELLVSRNVKWVELKHFAPIDGKLPCRTDKVNLYLPLPESPDALWQQLKPKVRNQIRKARQSQLTVHQGDVELLSEFYTVYTRNMRDLGSPSHHRRFFELIVDHFHQAAAVFVIKSGNRPVAAAFTLTDRDGLYVPWAGSDWRARSACPNMLLYWSMLSYACERGMNRFDFGRSTRDSGTYRFKKQWGAHEQPLHWQYLLRPGQALPDLRPDRGKYRAMVACWRRLPTPAARTLGPYVIGKLS